MEKLYNLATEDAMREIIESRSAAAAGDSDPNHKSSFFVCDLYNIYQKIQIWNQELGAQALGRGNNNNKNGDGGVELYYAIKCFPDPVVLQMMNTLNLGYDCASQWEIEYMLSLGAKPEKIIYANTIKEDSFIRYAGEHKVDLMTFDNADELYKIKEHHPKAKLVLRLAVDDEGSLVRVSAKFGVPLAGVDELLQEALKLELDIVGVCFHVGSGCTNPALYDKAIKDTRYAFDRARALGFEHVNLVNIGGGFEGYIFTEMAQAIRGALDKYFLSDSEYKDVHIMAEPGRFLVEDSCELATNIIGKRRAPEPGPDNIATMYYINSGVFDAFGNGQTHKNVHPAVLLLPKSKSDSNSNSNSTAKSSKSANQEEQETCMVWGPCCTALDVANKVTRLPANLPLGAWLRWPSMGAYSSALACHFNGFPISKVYYTLSDSNVPFRKDLELLFKKHSSSI